jgi:hypothetical protein
MRLAHSPQIEHSGTAKKIGQMKVPCGVDGKRCLDLSAKVSGSNLAFRTIKIAANDAS